MSREVIPPAFLLLAVVVGCEQASDPSAKIDPGPTPAGLVPTVTVAEADSHRNTFVESVIEAKSYKFARRRGIHFLYGTNNFRSREGIVVAFREKDLASWNEAERDLKNRFEGETIRARGKLVLDESQWLLLVTEPDNIKIESEQPSDDEVPQAAVWIHGLNGETVRFRLPFESGLPRASVVLEHEGETESYEGITLAAALQQAGVVLGKDSRGGLVARCFVVTSSDGYTVVLSLGEVDPYLSDNVALLADHRNGDKISKVEGPILLVLPHDDRHRRWVNSVATVSVRSALQE